MPDYPVGMRFGYANCMIVDNLTIAAFFYPFLKLFEVCHEDRSTKSAMVHKREETPTAMAGVTRIEE